jgi:hypothetical protein
VLVWANILSFNNRNWPMFTSQTANNLNLGTICFASNPDYSEYTNTERFYNTLMNLAADNYDNTVSCPQLLTSGNNVENAQIVSVNPSNNQITIQLSSTASQDFTKVYRMSFRFWTPRITTTTCTALSMYSSRWLSWFPFTGNAWYSGSSSQYCGNGGTNSN